MQKAAILGYGSRVGDVLGGLRAVWDFSRDADAWREGLAATWDQYLSRLGADLGTLVWDFSWDEQRGVRFSPRASTRSADSTEAGAFRMVDSAPDRRSMEAFYRLAPHHGTMREILAKETNRDHVFERSAEMGVADTVGFVAGDADGGSQIQALASKPVELSEADRWLMAGATAHLAAAYRLRQRLARPSAEAADAILSCDGEIIDGGRQGDRLVSLGERLREATVSQRQVRDSRTLRDEDVISMWKSLVDGRYTLIDFFEERGKRIFLVFENPYYFANPAALSLRQRDVLALAARGQNNRTVGNTLGLAASTVATHLAAAMQKLGFESRSDVSRYLGWERGAVTELGSIGTNLRSFAVERQGRLRLECLTAAERHVARLAARGARNQEIATARGVTSRTIANQLASIYEKLGLKSRHELAASYVDDGL